LKDDLKYKIRELEDRLADMTNLKNMEAQQSKMQAYREFQIKLKQQKQREKDLLESRLKQEEEMMMVEKNYQNLQEEVEDMRKLIVKLRQKYKQASSEI